MQSRPHFIRRPEARSSLRVNSERSELTLFWRIFLPNAALLLLAGALLVLSPAEVDSSPSAGQAGALAVGLLLMVVVNLILIRRAVEPLRRLTDLMARVDPLAPGQRIDATGTIETEQLGEVFNSMLQRIEDERRESGRRMLAAQEEERVRLARELHDEVGQSITGLMLEVDHAARAASPAVRDQLAEVRETARELSGELGEIVRRLRPETLDDLGLASALIVLGDRFTDQTQIPVHRDITPTLGRLSEDAELAVYRVAQESLTNVARHAGASRVWIELSERDGRVVMRVVDDGRGLDAAASGNGRRGMRERAMLVGGALDISSPPAGGVAVRLEVPVQRPR